MAWQADQIQAVVFLPPEVKRDALAVWQDAVGGEGPDAFNRSPSGTQPQSSNAFGSYLSHQLVITTQLGRIDFVLNSQGAGSIEDFPQIADYASAASALSKLAASYAERIGAVPRVALVLHLSTPNPLSEAAAFIAERAQTAFPAGTLDPMFQFNVRTRSKSAELDLNRLCTWSAGEMQLVNIANGQQPMAFVSRAFVALKVDVNTVVKSKVESAKVSAVFSECALLAVEIADKGMGAFS